ncbi:hypothetical protein FGO68_gene7934 [Halteria grandinella]|uniref:Uncharacterized protein n=1 Tax=Halteria grandinella TaxID=5974 RepID=A0A8J8T9W8_HALGN|nr:hypothetical protein FGO68_gene7934 [Halteria grandinella]
MLKKWETLKENIDVMSLMTIRTKPSRSVSSTSKNGDTKLKDFLCVLCQQHLFLFQKKQTSQRKTLANPNLMNTNEFQVIVTKNKTTKGRKSVKINMSRTSKEGAQGGGGQVEYPAFGRQLDSQYINNEDASPTNANNINSNTHGPMVGAATHDESRNFGVTQDENTLLLSGSPDYYLNIEFAKLTTIKNNQGYKCGFNLTFRDKSHDFLIQLDNQENNQQSPRFPEIQIASGLLATAKLPNQAQDVSGSRVFIGPGIAGGLDDQANKVGGLRGGTNVALPGTLSYLSNNALNSGLAGNNANSGGNLPSFKGGRKCPGGITVDLEYGQDYIMDLKNTFKNWMSHLNEWVVRSQNLKKFNVVCQIGVGGQA